MSASDHSSTKCWGFLLRSSFAILAARTRHLISVARIAAFSVASRLSNSSDIILRASAKPPHVGRLVRASGSKVLGAAMAPKNKSLAQINKSPDVGKATKWALPKQSAEQGALAKRQRTHPPRCC